MCLSVGGGGAGCAAALHAHAQGANVLLATKLRLGDSNSVMAQGGMQIAVAPDDSPVQHFLDTLKGGHMKNDHDLLKVMVEEGPSIGQWLLELGVLFDRQADGNLHVKKGGGSSKARFLTCSDYTGLEIMRVLKDEVLNQKIPLLEFGAVVELLSDGKGTCTGAVLQDLDNKRYVVVAAKTVILATGGIGRLHIQGFPTSNHYGATGDALVLAYRMGVPLVQIDTFQYHPSGGVYPEQLVGALVTEGIRSEGGHLVNAKGERFVNELDTRDVVSSSIIKECEEGRGVKTAAGRVAGVHTQHVELALKAEPVRNLQHVLRVLLDAEHLFRGRVRKSVTEPVERIRRAVQQTLGRLEHTARARRHMQHQERPADAFPATDVNLAEARIHEPARDRL